MRSHVRVQVLPCYSPLLKHDSGGTAFFVTVRRCGALRDVARSLTCGADADTDADPSLRQGHSSETGRTPLIWVQPEPHPAQFKLMQGAYHDGDHWQCSPQTHTHTRMKKMQMYILFSSRVSSSRESRAMARTGPRVQVGTKLLHWYRCRHVVREGAGRQYAQDAARGKREWGKGGGRSSLSLQ